MAEDYLFVGQLLARCRQLLQRAVNQISLDEKPLALKDLEKAIDCAIKLKNADIGTIQDDIKMYETAALRMLAEAINAELLKRPPDEPGQPTESN
jgi:hypothetical protein